MLDVISSPEERQVDAAPTSVGGLTVRVIESDGIAEALSIWRKLEFRLRNQSVTNSATWVENWLAVYGVLQQHQFLVAESRGVTRGICLIVRGVGQKVGPCPVRTIHLGTAGEAQPGSVCVEFNRILAENAVHEEFVARIVQHLQTLRGWDQIRLDGFSERDLSQWISYFPGAEIRSRESRYFDFVPVRQSGQKVIDALGKSTRANLRRRLRQYGVLDCEWANRLDQAEEIFSELIDLHQARWTAVGQPGAFASERFRRFQTRAVLKLYLEEKAVLFRVRHQGETVGCLLLLVDQNRLLDYLSGFADFNHKPSPGLVTHYLCMEEALRRNFAAYDFLVGEKRHKENLSNASGQLCWLTWSRPTMKMKVISAIRSLKQRLLKQSGKGVESPPSSESTTPTETH